MIEEDDIRQERDFNQTVDTLIEESVGPAQ